MSRIKTRKNFRSLRQYKQQRHKPKKGRGSFRRVKLEKGDILKVVDKTSKELIATIEWECD